MFELNGTYVIFVASFLVFMALLNEVMLKPVGRVLEARAKRIESDIETAKHARKDAATLVEKYEEDVRRIRSEAGTLIAQSIDQANKERGEVLAKIKEDGTQRLEQAKATIAAERETLIDDLVIQERALVEEITQKVLGEPVEVSLDNSKVRRTLEGAC